MTKKAATENPDLALVPDLVGLWFHSKDEQGQIQWQGHIVGRPEFGLYLVQLFEWIMGYPTFIRMVSMDDMKDWQFYRTDEEMRGWYQDHHGRRNA